MKKITTILVVIILLCRIGAMAQELNVERIKPFIENSSIIIEGKTEYKRINQRLDKTRDYGTYYTLIRFKPTAIFKGTIDTSKFYEILVQRGSYLNDPGGDGEFTAPDKGCVFPPESGIYFFTKEIKPPDFYKPSNDAIFLEYSEGIYGINYKRTNRTNAFKFLEEKFSLKPVLIVAPLEEKKSPVQNEVIPFQKTQKIKNDTSSNIKNYKLSLEKEALINNIKIKHFKTNSNGSKSVQSDDIIFELANATRTGTGPYNLDFDILVQANTNSTYLDNAWIDISYNTLAFGSYVVTNGTINAYGVGLFNGPYFVYMTDAQPNVFELRLQTFPTGPWTRTQITSSFTDMIHVSIVISDCHQPVNLGFTNNAANATHSLFTTNPADSTNLVINYTSTTYIGTINGTYCQPIINSFTDTVIPGAYYQNNPQNLAYMIIHGENFGPDQGIVYMPNADTGGLAYIPLNYLDIKTWNDSTIVLTMPSIIDSFPNILNPTYPTPGSGTFYVRTNNNDSAFSPHQVFCPYAISNIPYNTSWYRKVRVDLADMDSLGGYTFRPDLNVMSFPDPMFKWCIINGLEEWICATSINWKFGLPLNHYINSWYSDDTSTIFLVPVVPLRPWALASTKSFYDVCGILNDTGSYIFAKEIDIAIKATPTPYIWFCDTSFFHDKPANTYDFHAVWIHEAGHGHQLLHSDQNYDIMWWQFGHNYEHFWDRRYIQDEDRDGGRNVVQKSVADSFSIFCSHNHGDLIELPGNCVYGGDNVKELNPKVVSFKAYPNPINNSLLTIAYELIKDAPVQFILLDNLGKEVFNLNRTITAGKHTDQMSLRNQDAGIYYLEVIIDGIGDSQKLIKLH